MAAGPVAPRMHPYGSYRPRQIITPRPSGRFAESNIETNLLDVVDHPERIPTIARSVTFSMDRRSYKSHNGEVVWPPHIEETLVEALQQLLPDMLQYGARRDSLVKPPDRNKYCANYIKQKTGQERTARQVGSRIQMLRGKWKNTDKFMLVALPNELQGLLLETEVPIVKSQPRSSHPIQATPSDDGTGSVVSCSSPYTTQESIYSEQISPTTPTTPPEFMCWTGVSPASSKAYPFDMTPTPVDSTPLVTEPGAGEEISRTARAPVPPLPEPIPMYYDCLVEVTVPPQATSASYSYDVMTATFRSPVLLSRDSLCRIYIDNILQTVENVHIQITGANESRNQYTYVTEIIPRWWRHLLDQANELHRFEVHHQIFAADLPSPDESHTHSEDTSRKNMDMSSRNLSQILIYRFVAAHADRQPHSLVDAPVMDQSHLENSPADLAPTPITTSNAPLFLPYTSESSETVSHPSSY